MAGNQEIYQQSMNAGHNAAWDQNWSQAIQAYSKAIQQIPDDGEAHIHLGLALLKSGRLDDALKVYKRAHQLSPDDPTPLEKGADVLERMGRLREAAQQYISVADVYLSLRDLDKAIGNWERATQLSSGLITIHARLAQAYERVGEKKRALREYLTLAFNFQRAGDTNKAIKAVERALRIDKRSPQALNTLRALRAGGDVNLPEFEDDSNQSMLEEFGVKVKEEENKRDDAASNTLGPMGEAMQNALMLLAEHVAASGDLTMAAANAMQGMEFQRQGVPNKAIDAYMQASSEIDHESLRFNLGTLLYMNDQPADAIKYLNQSVNHKTLAAGALHAMGLAYQKLGKQKQASQYLLQSLQTVDTNLTIDDREKSELNAIYNELYSAVEGATNETLEAINARFADLLSGEDWKTRIAATRKHVQEVMRDQGDQGVRDFFGSGGSDKLASTVSRIDTYIKQGLLTLAMDEAHAAVMVSPYYLPVHVRMAEIMMREGRLRQAINKYDTIARAYMSREENDRAASILAEVLEMAPLDVNVRHSLISLLETEERHDDVLDQYVELAKTYNQLGNFDLSRETFQSAERMAHRMEAPPEKQVQIKHSLADMDQMRLDMRRAIKTYEEILTMVPSDERAYRALIDLNYNQGNSVEAIKKLDKLLGIYAQRKEINRIVQLLEELVRNYQTDTGLRSRLAAIYVNTNRRTDAIQQLDALGEIQLEAGKHKEARSTIKRIIKLKPDNIADYKRLLSQLSTEM